jgi:hypothetical protein
MILAKFPAIFRIRWHQPHSLRVRAQLREMFFRLWGPSFEDVCSIRAAFRGRCAGTKK